MFKNNFNCEKALKTWAKAFYVLGIFLMIAGPIAGIIAFADMGSDAMIIGVACIAGGFLLGFSSWFGAFFIWGFAQVIEKLNDIEVNTKGNYSGSSTHSLEKSEKVKKLESLRNQGLITEEEYLEAISQH